jgi:beta-glucosidase
MPGPPDKLSRRRFCAGMVAAAAGVAGSACSSGVGRTPWPSTSDAPVNQPLQFPDGFRWGVATSAYQIEGAVAADRRGRSIWDTFCTRAGTIADGSSEAVACDHYHRWESDLDLMHSLGIGSYRFSIAWPRVLPEGRGSVNRRGLDFYDRLVDGLLARGISPVATLYHWDLPQTLQDRGGWESRDSAEWFADYAMVLFTRLERSFTTSTSLTAARSRRSVGSKASAGSGPACNLPRATPRTAARRPKLQQRLPIRGRTPSISSPYSTDAIQASALSTTGSPLVSKLQPRVATLLPFPHRSTSLASTTTRPWWSTVRDDQSSPIRSPQRAGSRSILQSLYDVLERLRRDYASPEVMITENGVPDDPTASSQPTADHARVDFLRRHLRAVHKAIGEGCRVTGYHAWSLLDNFEWAAGYSQRWGLVQVDFNTFAFSPKTSALWYSSVLATTASRAISQAWAVLSRESGGQPSRASLRHRSRMFGISLIKNSKNRAVSSSRAPARVSTPTTSTPSRLSLAHCCSS